jgi:hypothetical protein
MQPFRSSHSRDVGVSPKRAGRSTRTFDAGPSAGILAFFAAANVAAATSSTGFVHGYVDHAQFCVAVGDFARQTTPRRCKPCTSRPLATQWLATSRGLKSADFRRIPRERGR